MNSSGSSSVSLSSWHTPTQAADRPVSPPRAKDNNFKIMLPKMGGNNSVVDIMGNSIIQPSAPTNNLSNPQNLTIPSANIQQSPSPAMSVNPTPMPVHHVTMPTMPRGPQGVGGGVKKEKAPEIIAIDIDDDDDEPEMKKPTMLSSRGSVASNSSSGGGSAVGMDPLAIGRPNHPSPSISKTEFTPIVDPLAADPLATSTITLEPIKKSKGSAGNGPPMVAINGGNLDLKPDNVKLEKQQQQQAGRIEPLKIKLSALPGSVSNTSVSQQRQPQQLDRPGQDQGEWCAVCHDGGDTLYCCDRCPKVYHLYCYIPAMDSEPADDWTCLMCENKEGIFKLSSKVKKGCNLTEHDSALCRRLLLEMYNKWPESVPFRDCADLNFDEYLAKISDPIALDVIKERLSEDSPNQYSSVKMFLADLRKMFRNAFIFNTKESEIYKHAKSMEDKLDSLLTHWAPQFANDPLLDVGPQKPGTSGVKRKNTSPDGSSTRGGGGAKRGRKVKRPQSRASDSVEEIDDLDEVDREQHEYLRALQNSIEDQDPSDTDFTPSGGSKRGRGRGRGRGRKS